MNDSGVRDGAPPSQMPLRDATDRNAQVALSVVVPVRDEAGNIRRLVDEICRALAGAGRFEINFVDDGSNDGTAAEIAAAMRAHSCVRCLRHPGGLGQSAALRTGIVAARGDVIVTMDGDGQNDPADIPRLLEAFGSAGSSTTLGMIAGQRVVRRDNLMRRISSRVANGLRSRLLRDGTPDTGCGLKLFRREAFIALPYFDHMHRFLPALMQRQGYDVRFVQVRHRPRRWGRSKYGVGNRLWVGIVDVLGVMWLRRRCAGAGSGYEEIERVLP